MVLGLEGIWHSPAFNVLLPLYSLSLIRHPVCYIRVLRDIRAKLPVFNDLRGWKSKATRISISAHKMCLVLVASRLVPNLHGVSLGESVIGLWIQHFGKLQKGVSKTFCITTINRMSSNKNVDIELESFLLDPDSSKGKKTLGKGRRNVIVFNWKKVDRW